MCNTLQVSKSGYYGWRNHVPSQRQQANAALLTRIQEAHAASDQTYGMRASVPNWPIGASWPAASALPASCAAHTSKA
jgi:hypothetical protein